jgi:hypothetical protein
MAYARAASGASHQELTMASNSVIALFALSAAPVQAAKQSEPDNGIDPAKRTQLAVSEAARQVNYRITN